MKNKILLVCLSWLAVMPARADLVMLGSAIADAQASCVGIAASIKKVQTLAGVNTAVTGIGTVASGVGLYAGIRKAQIDKEAEDIMTLIMGDIMGSNLSEYDGNERWTIFVNLALTANSADPVDIEWREKLINYYKQLDGTRFAELRKESKRWGNWRTGLLAGGTAASAIGVFVADKNKNDGAEIKDMVQGCVNSIKTLRAVSMQALLDGDNDPGLMAKAGAIADACGKYTVKDFDGMPKWSEVAKWSSIIGVGVGVAGTVTSVIANTDKVRDDDSEGGVKMEKGLNTASNVLAGAGTVAGAVATGFNIATLASASRLIGIAEECEAALD
jgi:hypothetical protein